MEDITVKGDELQKIIKESLPEIFKEKFTKTYSNPIADILEKEIKSQEGAITIFIREQISSILTDDKFKDLITKEVVGAILSKGLGNR